MRRFDAAPRRATPKGHKTFISCPATHQESRIPTNDSSPRSWRTNAVNLRLWWGRWAAHDTRQALRAPGPRNDREGFSCREGFSAHSAEKPSRSWDWPPQPGDKPGIPGAWRRARRQAAALTLTALRATRVFISRS